MRRPLVSVVIPVYNGAKYLREAIDSALGQTYPRVEVIVVNDGSADGGKTEEIALSYGDRIRYARKENGGVATALNAGISMMRGECFSWLSHDDVLYPEKIERQVSVLEKEGAKITACAYDVFYDSGRRIAMPIVDFYGREAIENGAFGVLHSLIQFGGVLFKKEIFEEYGEFREDLRTTQDYEFLFRVLRKERCAYDNGILYGIRYHEGQGSNTMGCVNEERDEMYRMFLRELSREEKEGMYGSCYNFYYQMLLRAWPMPGMEETARLCMEGLQREEAQWERPEEAWEGPVFIYGAGIYGKRLLFDLRCRGGGVAGFLDGDRRLWGSEIDGVACHGPQWLERGDAQVLIASMFRKEMADVLRGRGISGFRFKEQWERERLRTAPALGKIKEAVAGYGKSWGSG